MNEDILRAAKALASANVENEPNIVATYLFPSETEIRLIHLDPSSPCAEECVSAYQFPPEDDINYPCAIGLLPPEQKDQVLPPEGWGDWNDAQIIYDRQSEAA